MYLSCCVWALTAPEEEVLSGMQSLGFRWIDIRPEYLTTTAAQAFARSRLLKVSSVAASYGIPQNAALDSPDAASRGEALAHLDRVVAHCATLGGSAAYLVPGADGSKEALARYADSLAAAAEKAAARGVRLGVEHFPGTALPSAAATLEFINAIDHPNLGLLFDIGHLLISDEDPAAVIRQAGGRLAYVHLDDNDGKGDLHWALLDGVLTSDTLRETFRALQDIDYTGAISLELNPQLSDPYQALQRSRQIVLECGGDYLLES
jgi:D-psicose/D-tagatose/L-ribulose 3-epimerase